MTKTFGIGTDDNLKHETIDRFGWYNADGVDIIRFCTDAGDGSPIYAENDPNLAGLTEQQRLQRHAIAIATRELHDHVVTTSDEPP